MAIIFWISFNILLSMKSGVESIVSLLCMTELPFHFLIWKSTNPPRTSKKLFFSDSRNWKITIGKQWERNTKLVSLSVQVGFTRDAMLRSTVGKSMLKITVGGAALYGAGVALALQNDAFNELFTDNVPLAEEACDFVQSLQSTKRDYNVQNFKEKFKSLENTLTIPKASGIQSVKIDSVKESPTATKKVEEAKKIIASSVNLPLIKIIAKDPQIQVIIKELNTFIGQVNKGTVKSDEDLSEIRKIITDLDINLTKIQSVRDAETEQKLKELVSAKENELLSNFTKDFNENLQRIELKHQSQLSSEILTTKKALEEQFKNQIKLNGVKAQDEFTKAIRQAIENERDGKLAKFEELNTKLENLQQLVLNIDEHLNNSEQKAKLQFELNKLKFKLQSDKIENLNTEISSLNKLAQESKNDVIIAAINAINKASIRDGLLTQAQLITRFNLLAPELRSAALLPPNAGVLGHLSAKLFSSLLLSKEGDVKGNDIESVIARVQNNLIRNNLDDAVEEVANLKGWSRKIADDWLVESRKRLEVEFLVNLIDLESRTLY